MRPVIPVYGALSPRQVNLLGAHSSAELNLYALLILAIAIGGAINTGLMICAGRALSQ